MTRREKYDPDVDTYVARCQPSGSTNDACPSEDLKSCIELKTLQMKKLKNCIENRWHKHRNLKDRDICRCYVRVFEDWGREVSNMERMLSSAEQGGSGAPEEQDVIMTAQDSTTSTTTNIASATTNITTDNKNTTSTRSAAAASSTRASTRTLRRTNENGNITRLSPAKMEISSSKTFPRHASPVRPDGPSGASPAESRRGVSPPKTLGHWAPKMIGKDKGKNINRQSVGGLKEKISSIVRPSPTKRGDPESHHQSSSHINIKRSLNKKDSCSPKRPDHLHGASGLTTSSTTTSFRSGNSHFGSSNNHLRSHHHPEQNNSSVMESSATRRFELFNRSPREHNATTSFSKTHDDNHLNPPLYSCRTLKSQRSVLFPSPQKTNKFHQASTHGVRGSQETGTSTTLRGASSWMRRSHDTYQTASSNIPRGINKYFRKLSPEKSKAVVGSPPDHHLASSRIQGGFGSPNQSPMQPMPAATPTPMPGSPAGCERDALIPSGMRKFDVAGSPATSNFLNRPGLGTRLGGVVPRTSEHPSFLQRITTTRRVEHHDSALKWKNSL